MSERPLSRREFLAASCAVATIAAFGSLRAFGDEPERRLRGNPFRFGVASGDPMPDGIVLWTRLDAAVLRHAGLSNTSIPVRWEIADDEQFRHIARQGSNLAQPDLGHSVHAEVDGLQPGRHYWYRFSAGGENSSTGRTRTAPAASAELDRFQFAFVSCQHYEQGYFTAYQRLIEEDLDLVVHLGDYIYEDATDDQSTVRRHGTNEVLTLADYRERYSLYRADHHLQAAHAAYPWIVSPDDHEVWDNYAGAALSGHGMPRGQFLVRRAAAYQAYYEFMPLRRSSMPAGPDIQLFRRLRFGRLAEFHVLDTRQYRTDQPCGGGRSARCEQARSKGQHMLGPEQERWLTTGLRISSARWNILANQVMLTQVARVVDGTQTFAMDKWDGYMQERSRLLGFLHDARPSNPVVITGDIHTNWIGDLKLDFDRPASAVVGTEIVGTSITSGGDGSDTTPIGSSMTTLNPHVKFFNANRGYVRCALTKARLTSDFRTLEYVSRPDAPIRTRATFVVEDGRPGAQQM